MVKIAVLSFTFFVLAVVANAKPLSDQDSPQPVKNNVIVEEKPRLKRSFNLEGLFESIGGMVEGIIHEAGVHRRDRLKYNELNYIGNGRGNINYVTYAELHEKKLKFK